MDKIKLNNQIIDMRKFVKQGKLHILSKLVKQVRLLKVKKGNEAQMAKYQRKADRHLSEINILKKINVDSVSKMCLSSEEDWKSKISDNTISLENRVMARLANFKAVQMEVIKFRMKFPRLVQVLPYLIQQWEEKKEQQKHEEKKLTASEIKKRKKEKHFKLLEKKEGKQVFSKEFETNSLNLSDSRFNAEENEHFAVKENGDKENCSEEDAENSENEIEKYYGFDQEELNNPSDSNEVEGNLNNSNEKEENSGEHVDDVTAISNSENSVLKQNLGKITTLKTPTLFKSRKVVELKIPVSTLSISSSTKCIQKAKKSGTKEITQLNLEELTECSEIQIRQMGSEENETEAMGTEKRKRDPFFLGNDGESEEDGDEENDDGNVSADEDEITPRNRFRQNYSEGKFMLSKSTNPSGFNKNMTANQFSKFRKPERNTNKFSKFNRPDGNFSNQFAKNGRKPFCPSSDFSSGKQDFHFNKGSSNFGNKYPRDINRTDGQKFSKFNKEDTNSKFSSNANAFHTGKMKQPSLHPSWEAKKKQNMTKCIVAFQGKKIKFGD